MINAKLHKKVTAYITKWMFDVANQEWDYEIILKSLRKYQLMFKWSKEQNLGTY